MRFRIEDGRAVADFTPTEDLQGFPGLLHGGAIGTMLDEAMGWAAYGQGIWAMTARFSMRFRRPVRLADDLRVEGWVARDRGRFLEMRAELRSAEGDVLAEAEGVFTRMVGEHAEEVRRSYEALRAQRDPRPSA
jgi:acyl-coenzyme A thioesterase PaaI-like protein